MRYNITVRNLKAGLWRRGCRCGTRDAGGKGNLGAIWLLIRGGDLQGASEVRSCVAGSEVGSHHNRDRM